jgi:putative ABC transport system permease protein
MKTIDIPYTSLLYLLILLIIPLVFFYIYRIKLIKSSAIAVLRMTIQLFLVGIYIIYLFELNNNLINIAWILVMITIASFSVIRSTELDLKKFILPTFLSLLFGVLIILFYVNGIVIDIENIFDAKYLIVIGGMLIGNSLRGNIIGVNNFYQGIKRNENRYLYTLSAGATRTEALIPFFRASISDALKPTIATMATMGIVSLPGMLTGQILGGSDPLVAVKYQIMIMVAIFVSSFITIGLAIVLTVRICFDDYGILDKSIFKVKNSKRIKQKLA